MVMSNEEILNPGNTRFGGDSPRRTSAATFARGPIIDQDGREIRPETLGEQFQRFRFDFGHSSANPFGDLTREECLQSIGLFATKVMPALRNAVSSSAKADDPVFTDLA